MISSVWWTLCLKYLCPSHPALRAEGAASTLEKPPDWRFGWRRGMRRSISGPLPTRQWRQSAGQARLPEWLALAQSRQRSLEAPRGPPAREAPVTGILRGMGGKERGPGEQEDWSRVWPFASPALKWTECSGFQLSLGQPGWLCSPSPAALTKLGHPGLAIGTFLSLRCSEHDLHPDMDSKK